MPPVALRWRLVSPEVTGQAEIVRPKIDSYTNTLMPIRQRLYRFQSALCQRVTPGLSNSQYAFFEVLEDHLTPDTRWLDLGCGHQLMPGWMVDADQRQRASVDRVASIIGVDPDLDSLRKNSLLRCRLAADAAKLPFADASFDLITANMVVEHLPDPESSLKEIGRVMAPGGRFIFHTPNKHYPTTAVASFIPQGIKDRIVSLLDGRQADDVFPVCNKMNDEKAIHHCAQAAGLGVERILMVSSTPDTFMLGPLVLGELMFIRYCERPSKSGWRSNIIAIIQKPTNS